MSTLDYSLFLIPISISIDSNGKHTIKGNGCVLPIPPINPPPCFLMVNGPAKFEGDSEVWKGSKEVKNVVVEYKGKSYPFGDCRIEVINQDFDSDGINDYRIHLWPKNPVQEMPYYGI
ncbi:hypothetical protein CYY_002301 [Polysphondylium violaceum]|uniref:Uncharacterized protein n=1 Tax=Polysphondylium violaceum TaxID=133409 RepID=A0A8J4UVA2_9MYCE|nr:hypothetical protein CYY_002301 [Polysphondylium violaceum]